MIDFMKPKDFTTMSTDPVSVDDRPPVRTYDFTILMDTSFCGTLALQYGEEGYPSNPVAFFEIVTVERHGDDCVLFLTNTDQRFRAVFKEIDPLDADDPRRDNVVRLPKILPPDDAA